MPTIVIYLLGRKIVMSEVEVGLTTVEIYIKILGFTCFGTTWKYAFTSFAKPKKKRRYFDSHFLHFKLFTGSI